MEFKSELKKEYQTKFKKELKKELNLGNINEVPNLEKIVINSGVGLAKDNPELIDQMVDEISLIAGQKPIIMNAKDSISNFKIRQGMPIGVKVTLRGEKMWFFLEKLIHIVLPRVKDFRGLSAKSFDGMGNYSLGFRDQLVFPEIDTTQSRRLHGFQITICTNAKDDEKAKKLLEKFNFPFTKS